MEGALANTKVSGAFGGERRLLWLDECDDRTLVRAGSKISKLGTLRRNGMHVPNGFVVTTDVFLDFVSSAGLGPRIDALIDELKAPDDPQLDAISRAIRHLVESRRSASEDEHAIVENYEELSFQRRDLNIPLAVRSSATGEDATDASFAGQFETYLGVTGPQRLLEAVRRCWSSLFTPRAIGYRMQKKLDYRNSPMAVGVLELVHARTSGVAFSIHPVSGSRERMVIEGSWGWGEAVVQGLVQPDHIEVDKSDGRILDYRVSTKSVVSCFDYSKGLVVEQPTPKRLRKEPILDAAAVAALAAAVRDIEAYYGYPVDVEWVLERHWRPGEPVTIVQTRPVTVAAEEKVVKWNPLAYVDKYNKG